MCQDRCVDHRPRAKIIVNSGSGPGGEENIHERLANVLAAAGIDGDISIAKTGAEVAELASTAISGNFSLIVAGGGDGTVNAVAAKLVGTDKTLGVLPLGTLNHLAKDLNIPLDLEGAAQTLVAGRVAKIDVGEVNGRVFLNNSSIGLYPTIVRKREKLERLGSGKWPAFIWAALAVFRRYPFLDVHVNADGREFARRTPFVFVGNNEYIMEQLNIGGRERIDQGKLSLYMASRTGRWGLIRLALRALLGHLREEKDFLAMQTREVRIQTRHKRIRVATDGEVDILETPLDYRVRPGELKVMVPREESQ